MFHHDTVSRHVLHDMLVKPLGALNEFLKKLARNDGVYGAICGDDIRLEVLPKQTSV